MKNIEYSLAFWAAEKLNRKIIKMYNNVLAAQLMEQLLIMLIMMILLFAYSSLVFAEVPRLRGSCFWRAAMRGFPRWVACSAHRE